MLNWNQEFILMRLLVSHSSYKNRNKPNFYLKNRILFRTIEHILSPEEYFQGKENFLAKGAVKLSFKNDFHLERRLEDEDHNFRPFKYDPNGEYLGFEDIEDMYYTLKYSVVCIKVCKNIDNMKDAIYFEIPAGVFIHEFGVYNLARIIGLESNSFNLSDRRDSPRDKYYKTSLSVKIDTSLQKIFFGRFEGSEEAFEEMEAETQFPYLQEVEIDKIIEIPWDIWEIKEYRKAIKNALRKSI